MIGKQVLIGKFKKLSGRGWSVNERFLALTDKQIGYYNIPKKDVWISTKTLGKPKQAVNLDQVTSIEKLQDK